MATRTPTVTTEEEQPSVTELVESTKWMGATGAGIVAGIVMAVPMTLYMGGTLDVAIPALYGLDGGLAGMTAHVAHAAIFGVAFAAIVRYAHLGRYTDTVLKSAATGGVYGLLLFAIFPVFVMPAWLSTVGFANAPAIPNVSTASLAAHLVYGLVLGALYPLVKDF